MPSENGGDKGLVFDRPSAQLGDWLAELMAVFGQTIFGLRRHLGIHRALDQSVALEVEGAPNEHVAALIERRLDLTFVAGTPYSNGCDVERLWDEPIFAALPSGHQYATRELIDLSELARERFIVSGAAPGPEIHDFIIKRLSELGSSPCIRYFGVGRETLMALVGLTLGVSLVSGAEIGVLYPGVTFVRVTGESLPFSAIWSPDKDNGALRSFLSKARIRARGTAHLS